MFVEPARGWVNMNQTAQLASTDATTVGLGSSVSISGNLVAAGAGGTNNKQGAVYVFREPAGGWANETQSATLTASDGAPNDFLGDSVRISGNTVVGGAFGAAVNGNSEQGAAYIFGP